MSVPAAAVSALHDIDPATQDAIEQAATQAAEKIVEKTTCVDL